MSQDALGRRSEVLQSPPGTSPQVFSRRVRIFLHIDDSLAACVEQQFNASHTRTSCHVGCMDGIHVSTLKQSILLCVDCLTAIEIRTTWCLSPGTGMRMNQHWHHIM